MNGTTRHDGGVAVAGRRLDLIPEDSTSCFHNWGILMKYLDGAACSLNHWNRYYSPSRTISSATSTTAAGMTNGNLPVKPSNPTSGDQYYLDLRRELWFVIP